jgi:hypothetical protein
MFPTTPVSHTFSGWWNMQLRHGDKERSDDIQGVAERLGSGMEKPSTPETPRKRKIDLEKNPRKKCLL